MSQFCVHIHLRTQTESLSSFSLLTTFEVMFGALKPPATTSIFYSCPSFPHPNWSERCLARFFGGMPSEVSLPYLSTFPRKGEKRGRTGVGSTRSRTSEHSRALAEPDFLWTWSLKWNVMVLMFWAEIWTVKLRLLESTQFLGGIGNTYFLDWLEATKSRDLNW